MPRKSAVDRVQDVYATSYRRLVGQLTGVTGDPVEAEDAVMEAFARALASRRSFLAADNPEAWLRTVAVNVTRTRWRRSRFFRDASHRLVAAQRYDELPDDRLALLGALRQLPAAQREAIALHHLADLPVHEVAETVGAPVGTVKARLARGRAALAVLLAEPDPHPHPHPLPHPHRVPAHPPTPPLAHPERSEP
ncbi:MAG TPA: sigma-70 family RNA polymerase sigma factor [Nocardioides sp.]|nr:sigma-70 family RNA polymerase sigma factor [Nocardioides sp.]